MNEIIFHLNYVKGFVFQVNQLKKKMFELFSNL